MSGELKVIDSQTKVWVETPPQEPAKPEPKVSEDNAKHTKKPV